ncbi:type II toxin-antitoxin system Phd/YefM family antitoxin [Thiocapsa bogorovii]|uniref:type II toxin-antitoxin system Phd/YefM family antitoxin n=1 Tax=Thiocapsa bogorovii TaxID=521689 RepID=UPI001E3DE05A|nr:type II toxin-antitoxin system prevent-host-death family antitoxin [Thiocapsa bogorovii]UHD14763.1 type II toxin-antitoxin system prevent-host-death family antitoxin [Thiocapsa bogorovii]
MTTIKSSYYIGDYKMSVSVRELKSRLAHYLAEARTGQPIEITSHRRVIARLTAVPNGDEQGIGRLLVSGAAQWSGGKPAGADIRLSPDGPLLSELVQEDRG